MKKGYLGIAAAVIAVLIWACGEGSVEPVTDDELLMVGKWDPDITDVQEACDACLADPECKKEYDKFAKKHGCVPIADPNGEIGWDEDGDGEIDNWGDDSGLPNFKLSSSSKADDEEGEDDEGVSSDSEEDELSSSSRHSSSSAPVYSAASVSSEDGDDDPVVREQSSSSKASGTSSSSSAIVYSAASASTGDDDDDPNLPPESRSSSSKASGKSSSSSAVVYSAASAASEDEEDPNLPPESRSSSSKASGKSSSSSAIAYSATTYSSSDEEENPNVPPVARSSSSSKPKSSSSSSVPVYVVSSSSLNSLSSSSSSRAARSSSSGKIIETSSVSQSSSSAKSSSSIAPRSSSSKAKSSSSQSGGGTSQGVVCGSQLTGYCRASVSDVVAGEPVTYTYYPSEADNTCDGDIVWMIYDEDDRNAQGVGREIVHSGGTSFTMTYYKAGYKQAAYFSKGNRRLDCSDKYPPVTVTAAPPKNCSCTPTRTSSGTNDLFDQSPVNYKWTVSGCTVAGVATNDLSYSWSDGNTSGTGSSATVSYTSAGTFTPTVSVTTSEGKSESFTCGSAEVKNTPPQNCSCSAASLTSTSNDLLNVDQVSYSWTVSGCTGNGLTYSWSGADGSGTTASKNYTSAGTYTPKVTVKTATNASTTVPCGTAEVNNSGPTGCECSSITRKSSSNDLLDVSPVVYEWKATGCQGSDLTYMWGGTGISSDGSATATGTFTAGGSYTPTLRVSTARGGYTDVECVRGTVKSTAPSGCSCTASLRSDYNDLYQNSPVEYEWSVTGCSGNNLRYEWSNGVSGSSASVTGSFSSASTYTPNVKVTNMGGASTTVKCEPATVVNYAPPTCSVNNMTRVYIGTSVGITPSALTGCDNDSNGCGYSITLGDVEKAAATKGYKGGKIANIDGEGTAGEANYTLSLTNSKGTTGTCDFTVAYTDTVYVSLTYGSFTTEFKPGMKYMVTMTSNGGKFMCKRSSGNFPQNTIIGTVGGSNFTTYGYNSGEATIDNPKTTVLFDVAADAPSDMKCSTTW